MTATSVGKRPSPESTLEDRSPLISIYLAEFSAVRMEINRRSESQDRLLALNVSILGAIFGVVFGQVIDPLALLVIPPVSSSLGLLWLDHATAIRSSGQYIRYHIAPLLSEVVGDTRVMGLEAPFGRRSRTTLANLVLSAGPNLTLFIGAPVVTLGLTFRSVEGVARAFWGVEALLVGALFVMWTRWLVLRMKPVDLPGAVAPAAAKQ